MQADRKQKARTGHALARPFQVVQPIVSPPCLSQARRLGVVVGVGSSGAPAKIRHNLRSAGLNDLIPDNYIVSASEVRRACVGGRATAVVSTDAWAVV